MPRFLALVLALAALAASNPAAAQVPIDGIVAVVGQQVILRSEVEGFAMQIARGGPVTDEHRRAALEQLIDQQTLVEHALRDTTISVTPDEVNQTLDERTAVLAQQVGGEAALEQLYGRTVAQIKEDFRNDIREQLLAQELQRRKYFSVRITPQEVRQWFGEIPPDSLPEVPEIVRVAHVVRFPEIDAEAREEARRLVEALRDSILAGTPIEDLARRHSDDPGSAQRGGRYENVNLGDLVSEFGAVASGLEPGEVSQVFESQFGFHVMRLNQRLGDLVDFNHVLVEIDDSRIDATEALATLEALRDSVVTHGVPFAAIAKRHSEDATTAARGGNVIVPQTGSRDLRIEALGPLWRQTIDTLEVGAVSRPAEVELIDGRRAFHIVLLQRRTPAHRLSLETDFALIEEFALQEKRNRVLTEWIAQLRDEVFIEVRDARLQLSAG